MKSKKVKKILALLLSGALAATALSGCARFGFASDPDDPDAEEEEVVIDMSTDTFEYDSSLSGTSITILNSKAEIQVALTEIAEVFEEKSGVHIEVMPVTDGDSPYTKVVSLYNSGTPPTLAILDPTDVNALAADKALDLSDQAWIEEAGTNISYVDGKVYGFPLCVEGRGIIYNKSVIEETLGEEFDPDEIKTLSDFKAFLQKLSDAGMEHPISLAKEDWSLGAHHLQYIYETYDGTAEGSAECIEKIENGELDVSTYDRMNQFLDMFDTLKEYNVAWGDPLGADYDEMAIDLADGKTAMWFNGNWAWPNLQEAGAETTDEYGFLPYFMNDDEDDYVNSKIEASPSKQIMIDGVMATDQEVAAAKEFLNWIVYSEIGQQMLVNTCSLIPPFSNNPNTPSDPLSASLYEKVKNGETFNASAIVPNDHWSVLGAAMQKYLADRSTKDELKTSIKEYWADQT